MGIPSVSRVNLAAVRFIKVTALAEEWQIRFTVGCSHSLVNRRNGEWIWNGGYRMADKMVDRLVNVRDQGWVWGMGYGVWGMVDG